MAAALGARGATVLTLAALRAGSRSLAAKVSAERRREGGVGGRGAGGGARWALAHGTCWTPGAEASVCSAAPLLPCLRNPSVVYEFANRKQTGMSFVFKKSTKSNCKCQ